MISLKDIDGVGVEGGLGMGGQMHTDWKIQRGQIYDGEGMVGRVGNGRAKIYDVIEDMDSVGSGGRFGNGRANIYAY